MCQNGDLYDCDESDDARDDTEDDICGHICRHVTPNKSVEVVASMVRSGVGLLDS